jgi:hypothetical protein
MALFIEEMLDGGLEIGAWLRPEGGGTEGRPGGGGITEGRPEGGGIDGLRETITPERIERGPVARLDGGAEGGGTEGRLELGPVILLDGGFESGDVSPPRGPRGRSLSLISGNSPGR